MAIDDVFPRHQMASMVNHPVFVKDLKNVVCVCEFGWRVFGNMPTSTNVKSLQEFLGMVQYLFFFVFMVAAIVHQPLTRLQG